MLYILHGNNKQAARSKAHNIIDRCLEKEPDASFLHVTADTFAPEGVLGFTQSQGLFVNKCVVFLDHLFECKEGREMLMASMPQLKASDNIIVLLEDKADASTKKKFEKFADKVQVFEQKEGARERFNVFSLTEALGRRDKRGLWILLQKARMQGIPDEEMHGILFWQVKSMLLSVVSENAAAAGLKPFVFQKSKSFARNYSQEELQSLSQGLVTLYHDSRRGMREFDIALERFTLSI